MKRTGTPIAGALLAMVVALAGCGVGKDEDRPLPELPTTAAAGLRVTLDLLFREHVYLLGLATENAITGQTKGFDAAVEALEENALAIADQFEKPYAARGEKGFLTAWRPYTDLIQTYAGAKFRKLKLTKADRALAQAAGKFAAFAGALTPLINSRIVGARMQDLIASLRAAADAQVGKDFKKADASLRTAADRAGDIASIFARAFADDVPALFRGDPLSAAAALRASLSARLVEHVYFTAFTSENILTKQSKPRDGAKAAVDATSAALAKLIGSSYGAEAEKAFLPVWKRGVDLLIAYADSVKDKAKHEKARTDLGQYATDAAGFLAGLNRDLDAPTIERIIREHGNAMMQVFDAQAASDFKRAGVRLRAAAGQISSLAEALASATVGRFPARFVPTPAGLRT